MPDEVAEAIKHATLSVFATMVGVEVVPQAAQPCTRQATAFNIVSTFQLTGAICGTAEVYYTLPLATKITQRMLQVSEPVAEADVVDAAGEVANMVIGNVKNSLESGRGFIRIGTPSVRLSMGRPEVDQASSVSFRCDGDLFTVSVAFQQQTGERPRFEAWHEVASPAP